MRKFHYLLGGTLGFILAAAWLVRGIFASTNSTASIGFLFLPFVGAAGALYGALCVFSLGVLLGVFGRGPRPSHLRQVGAAIFVLAMITGSILWRREARILREAGAAHFEPAKFAELKNAGLWRGGEIRMALAGNSSAPPDLLRELAREDSRLLNVIGANAAAPADLVEEIARGTLSYDRVAGVAGNSKLPEELRMRLARVSRADFGSDTEYSLYQTFVLAALARRADLSVALLKVLLEKENPEYFFSLALLASPLTNCEQVFRFSHHQNEMVQRAASQESERRKCTVSGAQVP